MHDTRIHQVPSKVVAGDAYVGKWWCAASQTGADNCRVSRYLQRDGTWGKNTDYFDSKGEIEALLSAAGKPDFTMDQNELLGRRMIREDLQQMMNEDPFDTY